MERSQFDKIADEKLKRYAAALYRMELTDEFRKFEEAKKILRDHTKLFKYEWHPPTAACNNPDATTDVEYEDVPDETFEEIIARATPEAEERLLVLSAIIRELSAEFQDALDDGFYTDERDAMNDIALEALQDFAKWAFKAITYREEDAP